MIRINNQGHCGSEHTLYGYHFMRDLYHINISGMQWSSPPGGDIAVRPRGLCGAPDNVMCALMPPQIPGGRKSVLEAYGDIIFRAWKDSVASPFQYEIEAACIQVHLPSLSLGLLSLREKRSVLVKKNIYRCMMLYNRSCCVICAIKCFCLTLMSLSMYACRR